MEAPPGDSRDTGGVLSPVAAKCPPPAHPWGAAASGQGRNSGELEIWGHFLQIQQPFVREHSSSSALSLNELGLGTASDTLINFSFSDGNQQRGGEPRPAADGHEDSALLSL